MFKGNTIAGLFQNGLKKWGSGAMCPVHINGRLINMLVIHSIPFAFFSPCFESHCISKKYLQQFRVPYKPRLI